MAPPPNPKWYPYPTGIVTNNACKLSLWLSHFDTHTGQDNAPSNPLKLKDIYEDKLAIFLPKVVARLIEANKADFIVDPHFTIVKNELTALAANAAVKDMTFSQLLYTGIADATALASFKAIRDNGLYLPPIHTKDAEVAVGTKTEDRDMLKELLDRGVGARIYFSDVLWNFPFPVPESDGDDEAGPPAARLKLSDVNFKNLFDASAALVFRRTPATLGAMRAANRLGIFRSHLTKPCSVDPQARGLPPVTGNGKCCLNGVCVPSVYIYDYCQTTTSGACNSMSDACH